MRFLNRVDAGRQLAQLVRAHGFVEPVIVGLTRGGVPVAAEIARTLVAPLDICVVRKLMTTYGSTIGAVAEGGGIYFNEEAISRLKIPIAELNEMLGREIDAVARTSALLRDGPPMRLRGRNVVVVDDGLQSPNTMGAAIHAIRRQGPHWIELAVPVADARVLDELRVEIDGVTAVEVEDVLAAIGARYGDYSAVSDAEVIDLLEAHRHGVQPGSPASTSFGAHH